MSSYTVFPLPALGGVPFVHAIALNNYDNLSKRIQVVGYSANPPAPGAGASEDASFWERIDTTHPATLNWIDLGQLNNSSDSMAQGLNNLFPSQIVGWNILNNNGIHLPVLWEKTGTTQLNTLGGASGEASDVNDAGQVVGWVQNAAGQKRAFLWTKGAPMKDLGTLGGAESEAFAINQMGQVVGWAQDINNAIHAFLWTPGANDGVATNPQMKDLHFSAFAESMAYDLNDLGQVVGSLHGPLYQGFYWSLATGGIQLGNLGYLSEAEGINNAGTIVGYSRIANFGPPHAVKWQNYNNVFYLYDLNDEIPNTSSWLLNDAPSINERGDIACTGYAGTSSDLYAIILSPVGIQFRPPSDLYFNWLAWLLWWKRDAQYTKVIGGVPEDGSGKGITIGGHIFPIDPRTPFTMENTGDLMFLTSVMEFSKSMQSEPAKKHLQTILVTLIKNEIKNISSQPDH